jgi:hypothetical protein
MRGLSLLLLPLFTVGGSCTGSAPPQAAQEAPVPLALDRTDLSIIGDAARVDTLDEGLFRRLVAAALGEPPLLLLPPTLRDGRLDVVGVLEPLPPGEPGAADGDARLTLEARLRARGLLEPVTTGVAAVGSGGDGAALRRLLERALADLNRGLRAAVGLLGAGEERLILALDSAEPDEQLLAARLLSEHRSRAAVPALGRLLEDPRPDVAEAAAGALAVIGDPAAVPLVIRAIRRGDLRSEVRAIEVMAAIGGAEAEAYLEMAAVGHEVEEVRRLSGTALGRLRSGGKRL